MNRLARRGLIRAVEVDRIVPPLAAPAAAEPLFAEEWWRERVGADAEDAPGSGVPVTVVDSGLDLEHPEFQGRPETVLLNEQTLDGERGFHGTAVASVLAAPVNGVGLAGVYPLAALHVWVRAQARRCASPTWSRGSSGPLHSGPG